METRLFDTDSPDEQIVRFAKKWGPLGISNSGESLDDWRKEAQLARALLRFAAGQGSDRVQDEDWKVIYKPAYPSLLGWRNLDDRLRIVFLCAALNEWYARAGPSLIFQ